MNKSLLHQLKKPTEITEAEMKRMFSLMDENYDCVDFTSFINDLNNKDYASLLIDENQLIQGFSTYALNPAGTGTEKYNILFSGDTIINPDYWGSQILAKSWADVAGSFLKEYPEKKLYWLLISKGHRTFMYLPVFFIDFVPHPVLDDKHELLEIASRTAIRMFGKYYRADEGLIRFDKSLGQLKRSLAHGTFDKQQNEWVKFFLKMNPDFANGVELVCLTEISEKNMKPIGWRMVSRGNVTACTKVNFAATIWMLNAANDYFRFRFYSPRFQKYQERILKEIIHNNRHTIFGKEHKFSAIRDYESFTARLSVSQYEDLEPYIHRQIKGEKALFTGEVSFVETTSGSTSSAKKILYNHALREVFSRMANAWMFSLGRQYPSLWSGKSYWSLSPVFKDDIPKIEDAEYLSGFSGRILKHILAVPSSLGREGDVLVFYDQTCLHLLSQKKVVFFSVWSPVFLIRLLEHFISRKEQIKKQLQYLSKRKSDRAFKRMNAASNNTLSSLFPECKVISCWTDAQSEIHLEELRKLLGEGISIQGKGLLLTEGLISFPIDNKDPVLAYNAHFYEFKSTISEEIKLAHELEEGLLYEVIITTQAGLYRYNTQDVVKITGYWNGVPRLKFMGRNNLLGDFAGEKLSYQQVFDVFNRLRNYGINAYAFSLKKAATVNGYIVLADKEVSPEIEGEINILLGRNPYFALAIQLKQLQAVKIVKVNYHKFLRAADGLRREKKIAEGDFKEPLFIPFKFLKDE